MAAEYRHYREEITANPSLYGKTYQGGEAATEKTALNQRQGSRSSLTVSDDGFVSRLERILHPFFKTYDHDESGALSKEELQCVFNDLGEKVTSSTIHSLFESIDEDKSGTIDYKEFVKGVAEYIVTHLDLLHKQAHATRRQTLTIEDGEEEEAEEVRPLVLTSEID